MVEAGYKRTGVQCREKIKKLKSEYKKIKDNNSETGRGRKAWKFYSCMNEILGNKPVTQLATATDALGEAEQSEEALNDGAKDVEITDTVIADAKVGGENESGDFVGEDKNEKVLESDTEVKPQVEIKTEVNTERQRKKKHSRQHKFEKAMSIMVDKV